MHFSSIHSFKYKTIQPATETFPGWFRVLQQKDTLIKPNHFSYKRKVQYIPPRGIWLDCFYSTHRVPLLAEKAPSIQDLVSPGQYPIYFCYKGRWKIATIRQGSQVFAIMALMSHFWRWGPALCVCVCVCVYVGENATEMKNLIPNCPLPPTLYISPPPSNCGTLV